VASKGAAYISRVSFDEQRRAGEGARREAAAERSAARQAAGTATAPATSDALSGLVLHGALGGGAFGLGTILAVTFAPVVGSVMAVGGLAIVARGVLRHLRRDGARPSGGGAYPSSDPRVVAAYDHAREAIDGSRSLDEERRIELLAALRGGYETVLKVDRERPALAAAMAHLPPEGGGDAGARLREALDRLDDNRTRFIEQCAQLQATVATLALTPDRAGALDDLARMTSSLSHEAAADREVAEAIVAGRRSSEVP